MQAIIVQEVYQYVNPSVAMGFFMLLRNNVMTGILSPLMAVQIALKTLATPAHELLPLPLTNANHLVETALKQVMRNVMTEILSQGMAVPIVSMSFIQIAS